MLKLPEFAQNAISVAAEAIKDSPRPDEDAAIIDAARAEAEAS